MKAISTRLKVDVMSDLSPVRRLADIKNVVRFKSNSLFQSIAYVLLNHWDPLDISDSKGRNDAYNRFTPKVYSRALRAQNTEDLTQYLSFLSGELLGNQNNNHEDYRSACIIMLIKKYYLSNVI